MSLFSFDGTFSLVWLQNVENDHFDTGKCKSIGFSSKIPHILPQAIHSALDKFAFMPISILEQMSCHKEEENQNKTNSPV